MSSSPWARQSGRILVCRGNRGRSTGLFRGTSGLPMSRTRRSEISGTTPPRIVASSVSSWYLLWIEEIDRKVGGLSLNSLNRALHLHQGALESQNRLGRINVNRQENGDPMTEINKVLEERGRTHGDFADVAAVDQALKRALRGGRNWAKLSVSYQCALEMIVHKAARVLSGDPDEPDHW